MQIMKKYKFISLILFVFLSTGFTSCLSNKEKASSNPNADVSKEPVKVIFDTDIGGDWDDVGALAVLHSFANSDKVEILAMGVSAVGHTAKWGPSCVDAINTYFNRPNIPIGICEVGLDYPDSPYNKQISEEFPYEIDTLYNAAKLYRKVLMNQPDTSVVLITVGYFENVAELLNSTSDASSELSGVELVNKKVKLWVCMGGIFPDGGTECNTTSSPIQTKFAIDNWPRPILFSGMEIGSKIHTGSRLVELPESNPIRRAYEISGGLGHKHASFDQTAVVAAVLNPELYWEINGNGYVSMSSNWLIGNKWHTTPDKGHAYLLEKMPTQEVEKVIDSLMLALPKAE